MPRSKVTFAPNPDGSDMYQDDEPKENDVRRDAGRTLESRRLDSETKKYQKEEKALKDRICSLEDEVIKLQLENCHLSANTRTSSEYCRSAGSFRSFCS